MEKTIMNIDKKKLTTSNLVESARAKKEKRDRKQTRYLYDEETQENQQLLDVCRQYWESLQDFRDRRKRNRKYYRGEQWKDKISNPDYDANDSNSEEYITEEQYIINQGKVPLKQNIIRQLVRNFIGQYRQNPSKSMVVARDRNETWIVDMLNNALGYAHDLNRTKRLDARLLEEFSMSGFLGQKITYDWWDEKRREDVKIVNKNPAMMFFNTDVADPRLLDLNLIGEIYDMELDDIIVVFSQKKSDEEKIREWYGYDKSDLKAIYEGDGLSADRIDYLDFLLPNEPHKCRVIEVWEKRTEWRVKAWDKLSGKMDVVEYSIKEIDLMNQKRIREFALEGIPESEVPLIQAWEEKVKFWHVKYLTPEGYVLYESRSVYEHRSHPYVIALYPLLDGEVWGFVEDMIDQQRYINRLITLIDFIMGSSAKGVLMIPEESIPENMTPQDFATEWTRYNGVIVYKSKPGVSPPQQLSTNSSAVGAQELLSLQMKLIQEISGISNAVQGQTPKSGTPSSLYAQQSQNSMTNMADFMETFNEFKEIREMKVLQIIQQFYPKNRHVSISSETYDDDKAAVYNPDAVADLDFDVTVVQGVDTPVYRQLMDDTLMELLRGQMISLEMFLQNTSLPYAQNLLDSIRKEKDRMQQGQIPDGLLQQYAQLQGSPKEGGQQQQGQPAQRQLMDRLLMNAS